MIMSVKQSSQRQCKMYIATEMQWRQDDLQDNTDIGQEEEHGEGLRNFSEVERFD